MTGAAFPLCCPVCGVPPNECRHFGFERCVALPSRERIVARLAVNDNGLHYYIPAGYRGLVELSETRRVVYWTGRVAIGLRAAFTNLRGAC